MQAMKSVGNVFERRESAVRSYSRSFGAVLTTARGSVVRDTGGR
jgi:hypothetical protein